MRIGGLILCVTLAALGCGDDDNGTGGAAGMGGAGGAGGTAGSGGAAGAGGADLVIPTDACLDQLGLLTELADTIIPTTTDCTVFECFLEADLLACVRDCVADASGLSADCATCFGVVSDCVVTECTNPCGAGADSEACEACQDEAGCDQAFEDCAGFSPMIPGTGGMGGSGGAGGAGGSGGAGGAGGSGGAGGAAGAAGAGGGSGAGGATS